MANSFVRVNGALRADNGLKSIGAILIALAIVGAWISWAAWARVTRYEISDSARLEVSGSAFPLQANSAGELITSHLTLGRQVSAGDVLLELDSDDERLSLEQERTRLASLMPQMAALQSQMSMETGGHEDERRVLNISIDGARAQYEEALTRARLAAQEADRADRLHAEGILSEADWSKSKAEAQSKQAIAENLKISVSRLEPEQKVRQRDRDVRVKQLAGDLTRLEADVATSSATIRRLEHGVERRLLRAPVSGQLAECAALRPGAHISEGQQIGVILPSGKLQIVAQFAPSSALGKVKPGQNAIVRLQGFPWAQYGTVSARVSRVADDIRDGKVRVELAVNSAPHPRIPYQHGLPGSVEVEVERVSPAILILRSAGQVIGAH